MYDCNTAGLHSLCLRSFLHLYLFIIAINIIHTAGLHAIVLEGGGRGEGSLQTSDDESLVDNASVYSGYSENYNGCSDNHSEDQEQDGVALQDMFEEKLTEAIDGLTQKSAQGRTSCFEAVSKALIKKYIPDYLNDR